MTLSSFRDPNVTKTYKNFDKSLNELVQGNFSEQDITESKLLVFQNIDRSSTDPTISVLSSFIKGVEEQDEFKWYYFLRTNALDCTKDDILEYVRKYI